MSFITTNWIADVIILSVISIYFMRRYFTRNFDYWQNKGVPFIKPIPVFGNFIEAALQKIDIGECLYRLYKQFDQEPYFGIWVFNTPHFIVRSPDLIKSVLVKDFNYFFDRTVTSDESADSIAANFLFLLKNPEWKEIRSKMTPVFSSGKLKNMFELINAAGDDLKTHISKISIHKDSEECKELCAKFTTDVLTSTAFGINANCFEHENSEFREIGRKMFSFNIIRALKSTCYFFAPKMVSLFKLTFFDESVYTFLRNVFWQTIKQREESNFKRNDLIDVIVQMKKDKSINASFHSDKVVAQALQFYAAGFETTSATMAFTLYELCLQPKIQETVRAEIKHFVSIHGKFCYESIQAMKYLNMVISETLRKYPVLPFLDRRCNREYKVPGTNLVLEKGTPVYIPMIGLHKDPKYFPNPEFFDPERFNEKNIKSIPPYAYIPFGEGPHNCIGARFGLIVTKIGLVRILSEFEVLRNQKTPDPIRYDPKSFIKQSIDGLPMRFRQVLSEAA